MRLRWLRRTFAVLGIAAALATVCAAPAFAQPLVTVPFVGAVTDSSATISVWAGAGARIELQYGDEPTLASAVRAELPWHDRDTVYKFVASQLEPSTRYYYRILDLESGAVNTMRSFETFPRGAADAPVAFWFGSCQQSRADDSGAVFGRVSRDGGDLFIQMGDWAYPDVRVPGYPATDSSVVESYRVRLDGSYPFPRTVLDRMPVAYVWDDHDAFGDNSDGASDPVVKERARRLYREHVPHYPLPNPDAGIWQSLQLANVDLFLLDSRSQRSPIDSAIRGNRYEPPAGHSMLAGFPISGVDQRSWLLDALRRSTARWKVIVSPVPFNPAMQTGITAALFIGRTDIARQFAEYWAGYPADIDSLTRLLRSPLGRNVVIISGSAHTNMLDDGTHSIVPELVAANLDIPNSNLRDLLQNYGLNVWTMGQTGTNNTVGRIRVETAPVHRLIMESFDEDGELELQYIVTDSSSTGMIIDKHVEVSSRLDATISGRVLHIRLLPGAPPVSEDAMLSLYDVTGALVLRQPLTLNHASADVELSQSLAPGVYVGSVDDGEQLTFRIVVGE